MPVNSLGQPECQLDLLQSLARYQQLAGQRGQGWDRADEQLHIAGVICRVGDQYYIGNPSNAGGQTFVVTFTAG